MNGTAAWWIGLTILVTGATVSQNLKMLTNEVKWINHEPLVVTNYVTVTQDTWATLKIQTNDVNVEAGE